MFLVIKRLRFRFLPLLFLLVIIYRPRPNTDTSGPYHHTDGDSYLHRQVGLFRIDLHIG